MAGGAAMNVTIKSGTNEFHGAAWEFSTNSKLKARNYFYCLYSCTGDPNRAPKNVQNQFGAMFGGPVIKNKLFFFGDWERTTRRQAASALRTIPTNALRNGDFTGTGTTIFDPNTGAANGTGRSPFADNKIPVARIDAAAAYMANLIPQPNQSVFPNNYLAVGGYEMTRDNVDFKINYVPSDKAQVFGRYSFSPTLVFDPPSLRRRRRRRHQRRTARSRARPDPERRHRRYLHFHASRPVRRGLRLHPSPPLGPEHRH